MAAAPLRRIVVSGANKGIGLEAVRQLVTENPDIFCYVGSRSMERGEAAVAGLLERHPEIEGRVQALQLDVTSDESVAAAVETVRPDGELYAILNNAGCGNGDIPFVCDVNVYGVRRVTESFLPLMNENGRIVIVSSSAGPSFVEACTSQEMKEFWISPDITWEEIDGIMQEFYGMDPENYEAAFAAKEGFPEWMQHRVYQFSKACVNGYMLHLAREYPNMVVHSLTPGFIITDLTEKIGEKYGKSAEELGAVPVERGTVTIKKLLLEDVEGNGMYWGSDGLRSPLHKYRSPNTDEFDGVVTFD